MKTVQSNYQCKEFEKRDSTTQDEARQYAIDWQDWVSEQNKIGEEPTLYTSDLVEWSGIFEELGKRFDLTEEFIENGII
jgi:hypothetical protein